jgi:guanylate kinase
MDLVIVSAASGAGKSTLCARLLRENPRICFSISHTTRKPREGEIDGREYHFISREQFLVHIEQGDFLEHADVHGNLYGTSRSEIARAQSADSQVLLFDVDVQGAQQIRMQLPAATSIFVLPPSFAELERRLRARNTESETSLARRLADARAECAQYERFDYVVINESLESSYDQFRAIIVSLACKKSNVAAQADSILRAF